MAIVQNIIYNSDHDYFGGFLQHLIDESGITGNISKEEKGFRLVLDDSDSEALERFSSLVQKHLPHSVFLGESSTSIEDTAPEKGERFTSDPYPLSPCPICIEMLTDPASERYLDDGLECLHYSNEAPHRYIDEATFSPHYNENDTILLTDPAKVDELFYATKEELQTLFSIEKPAIKLTIKDDTLKETVDTPFFFVKAPYSVKSYLAALNAKESGLSYLFFDHPRREPKAVVIQKRVHLIYDNKLETSMAPLHDDPALNRFANIQKEAGFDRAVCAYLSRKHGIRFMVSDENGTKDVIKFQPYIHEAVMESMQKDKTRSRLLANLKKSSPGSWEGLMESADDPFEAMSAILEIEKRGFSGLSNTSLLFNGNGGLKIDMHFSEKGFDYEAMIGSVASFKIAGVEKGYLAYSIFEAYGDMAVSVLTQLKRRYKIDRMVILGDMLENSVLFSRLLSKLANADPYISSKFALDG